ncbi:MAG: choice-of-anchor B family protein [Flavobacteriales bacterium]
MIRKFLVSLAALVLISSVSEAQTPCENGMAGPYPCNNVDLLSTISLEELGGVQNMNDIWGWTHSESGREFAIVGLRNGTTFVEVSDPLNPVVIGFLDSSTGNSLWRDVKVYNNHAFIVSEADSHGMQIFDLTRLLPPFLELPVEFDVDAFYGNFGNAHNIVINEESGYAYGVGTGTFAGGLHIIDIQDPINPVIVGGYAGDGYTHDAQVVMYTGPDQDYVGREIAFCCNEDAVTIVDVTDKLDPQMISTLSYDNSSYTHQGWLTDDQYFFIFNDEIDELDGFTPTTKTLFMDIEDLDFPTLHYEYFGTSPAIDHNLYNEGSLCYQSNYTSGLRVLDVGNVFETDVSELGFFDSQPQGDAVEFTGTWSNYVYFPSGLVIMSDMYGEFFLLQPNLINAYRYAEVCGNASEVEFYIDVTYNQDITGVISTDFLPNNMSVEIGEIEAPGQISVTVNFSDLIETGTYTIPVSVLNGEETLFTENLQIVVENPESITVENMNPENGFSAEVPTVLLSWDWELGEPPYTLTIATDAEFTNVILSEVVANNGFAFDSPGSYYWRLSRTNACGLALDSDVFMFENTSVVSVEEITSAIKIFPNPVTDVMTISGVNGKIEILSSDGRLLKTAQIINDLRLDVSDLSSGVYFLRLKESEHYSRFIKE